MLIDSCRNKYLSLSQNNLRNFPAVMSIPRVFDLKSHFKSVGFTKIKVIDQLIMMKSLQPNWLRSVKKRESVDYIYTSTNRGHSHIVIQYNIHY